MAFKLSQGSLFAVLLRSSWWASASIAIFLLVASILAVDGRFIVFGIAAAFPFAGIAAVAAYRQAQKPSAKKVEDVMLMARNLPARELTAKISAAYQQQGYEVLPYKGRAGDIILEKGPVRLLLNGKRCKAANTGVEPLASMLKASDNDELSGYRYIALGAISNGARQYAQENRIELIQGEALANLLKKAA